VLSDVESRFVSETGEAELLALNAGEELDNEGEVDHDALAMALEKER
jgi:hypothetical protein